MSEIVAYGTAVVVGRRTRRWRDRAAGDRTGSRHARSSDHGSEHRPARRPGHGVVMLTLVGLWLIALPGAPGSFGGIWHAVRSAWP